MKCATEWQHLSAKITVDCAALEDTDDDRLEEHVVHELLHAAVGEMRAIVQDNCANCGSDRTLADGWLQHEERVVTQLAAASVAQKRDHWR